MSEDDSASAPQSRMRKAGSALLLAFCCFHAVFLIVSVAPKNTFLAAKGNFALDLYRTFIGGPQQWNLFHSIPDHHSLELRIVLDDAQGGRSSVGCVLPGFTDYPSPEKPRYYNLFYRMLTNDHRPSFFEAYLRRLEAGLKARHGGAVPGSWELVADVEWTRTLLHIKRDGRLYAPGTRSFDAANPGGITR